MKKNLKSLLALIMALVMVFALAACGSSNNANNTTNNNQTTNNDTQNNNTQTASNPVKLTFSTFGAEDSILGMTLKYFGDYLVENSNGEITYDIYYNNEFCSMPEQFDNLSNGLTDVCDILLGMYGDRIPYFDVTISDASAAASVELCKKLFIENEATASLAQAQLAQHNLKLLSFDCTGGIAYIAREPISCYDDLKNMVFGTARNYDYFKACGLNAVMIDGGEIYESLRLGTCDATSSTFDSIVTNMYYEVAPYGLRINEYNIVSIMCMNQDTYNNMTAEQQAIVDAAAEATMAYNVKLCEDSEAGYIETIEAATGETYGVVTDEELAFIYKTELESSYAASKQFAENLGCVEEFKAIVQAQYDFSTLGDGTTLNLD